MPSARRLEWWAGVAGALAITAVLAMMARPSFSNASRPQNAIADPVLALQMARTVDDVDAILADSPSPDREVMRIKQYLDFGFIASYGALYVLLSILLARVYPWGRWLGIAAGAAGIGAAVCDWIENLAILKLVNVKLVQTTPAMIDAVYRPSIAKWTLAFLTGGLLSTYFLADSRWLRRIAGAIFLGTSLAGFYALFDNPALVYASAGLGVGLIAIVLLMFRRWLRLR